MRTRFDRQLEQLNVELIRMGALCEEAISIVAKSLLDSDLTYLPHALDLDDQIDDKEREIEALCMKILLQQQPVASDLRVVSSALKMISDMERIGDQARISSTTPRRAFSVSSSHSPRSPGEIRPAGSTAVASRINRPAPENASCPRWIRCQEVAFPSSAEY